MIKLRIVIPAVFLALILVLTVRLMTAITAKDSNQSTQLSGALTNQQVSNEQRTTSIRSFRSKLGECFDVQLADIASCQNANKALPKTGRSQLDPCYDVGIAELAACQSTRQPTAR